MQNIWITSMCLSLCKPITVCIDSCITSGAVACFCKSPKFKNCPLIYIVFVQVVQIQIVSIKKEQDCETAQFSFHVTADNNFFFYPVNAVTILHQMHASFLAESWCCEGQHSTSNKCSHHNGHGLASVTLVLRKLRGDDYHELEVSLGYIMSLRSARLPHEILSWRGKNSVPSHLFSIVCFSCLIQF